MKIVILFSLIFSVNLYAKTVDGTISYKKAKSNDTLFIIARKMGVHFGPPVAVKKITSPTFPLKFKLGPENVMIRGVPFKGPFTISAKLSPTGNALDRSGPSGQTPQDTPIYNGDKDVKIELN